MKRKLLRVVFFLILGALGGMLFQAFILPYLATKEFFQRFQFVKMITEREVNIHPTSQVFIQENVVLQDTIGKVEESVVGVRAQSKAGKIIEGTGLIITNDGLLVTLNNILPKGYDLSFYRGGEKITSKVLKVDAKENLALVKMEKNNLLTAALGSPEKTRLGQRVFLIGTFFSEGVPQKVVNEGIIKSFNEDSIKTNIFEDSRLQGSPLFNIEGEAIGLITIDKNGEVSAIPVKKIRDFAGF